MSDEEDDGDATALKDLKEDKKKMGGKEKPKVREKTKEERLMTPKEIQERKKKRLQMSGCCMEESWDLYNKLIDPLEVRKNLGGATDNDDTVRRRFKGLENKYELFKLTLDLLKEAPWPPFMRISHPTSLHQTGGRHHQLYIARAQRNDREPQDIHPSTIAYTKRAETCFNTNFILPEDVPIMLDGAASTIEKRTAESETTVDATPIGTNPDGENQTPMEEAFEYKDYPIDEDGNPVGKSTGNCQYCGQEVIPLPTPHQQSVHGNASFFYCCKRYKDMMTEVADFEKRLQTAKEKANAMIDIGPHGPYDPSKEVFPGFGEVKKESTQTGPGSRERGNKKGIRRGSALSTEGGDDQTGTDASGKSKAKRRPLAGAAVQRETTLEMKLLKEVKIDAKGEKGRHSHGNDAKKMEAARKDHEEAKADRADKRKAETGSLHRTRSISTTDLPWDPYETFFRHTRYFNPEVFDDPLLHCYPHPNVVLTQDELYDYHKVADVTTQPPKHPEKVPPGKQEKENEA